MQKTVSSMNIMIIGIGSELRQQQPTYEFQDYWMVYLILILILIWYVYTYLVMEIYVTIACQFKHDNL